MKFQRETTRGMWIGFWLFVAAALMLLFAMSRGWALLPRQSVYDAPVSGVESRARAAEMLNARIEGK